MAQVELQRNETVDWPEVPRRVLPLSKCAGRCSARGSCVVIHTDPRLVDKPRCECYYGWQVDAFCCQHNGSRALGIGAVTHIRILARHTRLDSSGCLDCVPDPSSMLE